MRHTIELDDFREWTMRQWFQFASDSKASKRLEVSLVGSLRVTVNGDVVYEGQNASDAVAAYNEH